MRGRADYVTKAKKKIKKKTKTFQLVGLDSGKIYFKAQEHASLQRWLDVQFGVLNTGTEKNKSIVPMPEPMRIVEQVK